MDQNTKVAHGHKKYYVQPKAVVDIFCNPVVPFSTGVTLTKRPFNSYERQVAEFFQNNVHLGEISETGCPSDLDLGSNVANPLIRIGIYIGSD